MLTGGISIPWTVRVAPVVVAVVSTLGEAPEVAPGGDGGFRILRACSQGEVAVPKPLKVNPAELHLAAGQIEGHAGDFATAHQAAHWRAGQAALGSGLAAAALTGMLEEWESDDTRFGEHFTQHADGHRTAADAYLKADGGGASGIGDAGSAL